MRYSEKDLTDREFQMLHAKLRDYDRSHGVAYFLWFFLGVFGGHKFYIGKVGMGIAYLGLWSIALIGLMATFANPENVGWWLLPGGALGLMLLYDLFTIPAQIAEVKRTKKGKLIQELKRDG